MNRRTRTWLVAGVLLVLLAVWVLVPHPLEGPVLLTVSDDHGIHLADLAGVAVVAIGLVPLLRRRSGASEVQCES